MVAKKSKYKSVVIKKKRYYFYKITWVDPTGDSGHATAHDSLGLKPSVMITHAYLFDQDKKNIWTFASYEQNDELFSDRNVFQKDVQLKWKRFYFDLSDNSSGFCFTFSFNSSSLTPSRIGEQSSIIFFIRCSSSSVVRSSSLPVRIIFCSI